MDNGRFPFILKTVLAVGLINTEYYTSDPARLFECVQPSETNSTIVGWTSGRDTVLVSPRVMLSSVSAE